MIKIKSVSYIMETKRCILRWPVRSLVKKTKSASQFQVIIALLNLRASQSANGFCSENAVLKKVSVGQTHRIKRAAVEKPLMSNKRKHLQLSWFSNSFIHWWAPRCFEWSRWLVAGRHLPTRLRRQQGDGWVKLWAAVSGAGGMRLQGPFACLKVFKWTTACKTIQVQSSEPSHAKKTNPTKKR